MGMRFKEWLKEDTTVSGDQYGNDISPDDRGLVRPQYLTKKVPDSEMATKLFGGDRVGKKFMRDRNFKPKKPLIRPLKTSRQK